MYYIICTNKDEVYRGFTLNMYRYKKLFDRKGKFTKSLRISVISGLFFFLLLLNRLIYHGK
jgi:hypothetical protein